MSYTEFLRNKSVVLVGPAPTVFGMGSIIESFDIVVRLKTIYVASEKDHGKRTDILYTGLQGCFHKQDDFTKKGDWYRAGVRWVCMYRRKRSRHRDAMNAGIQNVFNYRRVTARMYRTLKKRSGGYKPFLGVGAWYDLSLLPIKHLHICGFTFYDPRYGAYVPGWQPLEKDDSDHATRIYDIGMAPKHYAPAQLGFMRNVTRKSSNITVDRILGKILETPNKVKEYETD